MVAAGRGRAVVVGGRHGRLQLSALGVLALAFVGVLMATESLGGGEAAAAVVALELPAGFGCGCDGGFCRNYGGVVGDVDAEEADGGGGG